MLCPGPLLGTLARPQHTAQGGFLGPGLEHSEELSLHLILCVVLLHAHFKAGLM